MSDFTFEITEGTKPVHLDFFSPAPINSNIHPMDIAPVKLLNRFHQWITASWRAIPVPAALHEIDKLPPELKKHTLPLLPNTDFMPARLGEGPACHRYNRAFAELRFVATLGCVGWGLATYDPLIKTPRQLIGKKIGVEPEGGAPRVLMDAVLRDAWGIYGDVILKDYYPPRVKEGLLSGDIDATFWLRAWEVLDGFTCSDPDILDEKDTHWIGLSLEDINRMNTQNSWKLHRLLMPMGSIRARGPKADPPEDVGLPGFTFGICAWEETEGWVVYELLKFLDDKAELWPEYSEGCLLSLGRMSRFPGMTEGMVHPGALIYYKEKGISIGGQVELRRIE